MRSSWLLAFLLLPLSLFATLCIPDCECDTDWTLEVRGAYFRPNSKKLKEIYSSCLIDYQITLAKRVHDYWEIWGEFDWAIKRATIHRREMLDFSYRGYDFLEFKDRSRISLIPVSLGLKFIYPILPCVDAYVGAGVSYSFLRIRNRCEEEESNYADYEWSWLGHDSYNSYSSGPSPVKKLIHKQTVGALVKLGVQYAMSDYTFLDLFADYSFQQFHFSRHKERDIFKHRLDCSGFKFGIGFGVYF